MEGPGQHSREVIGVVGNMRERGLANEPTFAVYIAVTLLVTAALACYVPARRVLGVDPVAALRTE